MDLEGQIPPCYGGIYGVNSPMTGPTLERPPAQNCYFKPRISATPEFGAGATTQPPDPTLPSRAHHKDYVSRTTSSNNYMYRHIFRTLRATAAPSTYGPGNWGETPMADHPLIQTLGKTWTRIRTQNDAENR